MPDSMDIVSDKQQQTSEDAAAATSASASSGKKRAAWNTPKYREEMDNLQSRFADQSFNAADYGDPLTTVRPLKRFYEREFPEEELQIFAKIEAEIDEQLAQQAREGRQ